MHALIKELLDSKEIVYIEKDANYLVCKINYRRDLHISQAFLSDLKYKEIYNEYSTMTCETFSEAYIKWKNKYIDTNGSVSDNLNNHPYWIEDPKTIVINIHNSIEELSKYLDKLIQYNKDFF